MLYTLTPLDHVNDVDSLFGRPNGFTEEMSPVNNIASKISPGKISPVNNIAVGGVVSHAPYAIVGVSCSSERRKRR